MRAKSGGLGDGKESAGAALERWPPAGLPAAKTAAGLARSGIYRPASRIEIDWQTLLEQRPSVLRSAPELPPYLLLPEIHRLLRLIKHTHRRLLFASLWITGSRISEALALTPMSFSFDVANPHVAIAIPRKRGRPKRRATARKPRLVPIRTEGYLDQMEVFINDEELAREQRLFPVSRQAVDAQLRRVVSDYEARYGVLPVPVSCQTFRHSFAVNCILHQVPLPLVQAWMGHEHIQSTMIYTQVLALESEHMISKVAF